MPSFASFSSLNFDTAALRLPLGGFDWPKELGSGQVRVDALGRQKTFNQPGLTRPKPLQGTLGKLRGITPGLFHRIGVVDRCRLPPQPAVFLLKEAHHATYLAHGGVSHVVVHDRSVEPVATEDFPKVLRRLGGRLFIALRELRGHPLETMSHFAEAFRHF